MKNKSLLIFDCDGVLRSASWEGLFKSYVVVIEHLEKDYRDFFRNIEEFKKWWDADWKKNNAKLGVTDPDLAGKIFYEHYEPHIALFPWASDILKRLSQKHVLAMATNASQKSVENFFGDEAGYFSVIASSENVKKLKPDPEIINFILKKLDFLPSQATMIGDMAVDILAGKNASIKTGAVSWGLGEWEDLLKLNPDHQFKNPEDLLDI